MSSGIQRLVRIIDSETKHNFSETTKKFRDCLTADYIILLGDPGSGKTYTFEESAKISGSKFMSVRRFLTTEGQGCDGKTLYLDGLDEYRSRSDNKNIIIKVIQLLNRLECKRFRLSCRSADWLGNTDLSNFKECFEQGYFLVLNLEPLTNKEIDEILEQKNIPSSKFVDLAEKNNISNLLLNPQTLIMLTNVVGHGNWPNTKKELYEKSVELLLSEHSSQKSETEFGKFDYNELLDVAGILCALILISDTNGVSIKNHQTDENYPTYRSIPFEDKIKLQAVLTRRLFTAIDAGNNFFTFIHRTIAEFIGAKWLAIRIGQGLPVGRVQSLFGVEGCPTSELRGLHAWLVTFLSEEYASILIPKDPYGVLMYGDAASLSLSNRKLLLMELKILSETDPWFRAGDWSTKPLGSLSSLDMVNDFRCILKNPRSNFHLKSIVFEAIKNGPPLPQMRDALRALLSNNNADYQERVDAIIALWRIIPTGKEDLVKIYRNVLIKDPKTHKLRSKILMKIYAPYFNPKDVYCVFKDTLNDPEDHTLSLWYLARSLPQESLLDVVGELHNLLFKEGLNKRYAKISVVESAFTILLERLLELKNKPKPLQLFHWLQALYYFKRNNYSESSKNGVSEWLKQHEPYMYKMFMAAYNELIDEKKKKDFIYDFQKITMRVLSSEDLAKQILGFLKSLKRLSKKEYWLCESSMSLVFENAPKSLSLYLDYYQFAQTNSMIMEIIEKHSFMRIPLWKLDENSHHRKDKYEKEKQKVEEIKHLTFARKTIRSGNHLIILGHLANIFFGIDWRVDQTIEPLERLRDEIGDKCTLDAIEGFFSILHRDDMPTPKEVATGRNYWWYALLAGMDLYWDKENDFGELSDKHLISLYALACEVHTYEYEENTASYTKREWQTKISYDRPDLAEVAIKGIIEEKLLLKKKYIGLLNELVVSENKCSWGSQFSMQMLSKFSSTHSLSLMNLICLTLSDTTYHNELVSLAKKVIKTQGFVKKERRIIWLTLGFILDFQFFKTMFCNYSKERNWVIWIIIEVFEKISVIVSNLIEMSVEQNEFIISLFGKQYINAYYPNGSWSGSKNPWDAAKFIRARIDSISALTLREATISLKHLIENSELDSYHEHLKHALANQLKIRRESQFVQLTWKQTLDSLFNDSPANIADLHSLILSYLKDIQSEIKKSNTDKYKMFWKTGDYGRIEKPEIEDICRDRLVDFLKPKLHHSKIHVEPEGHMSADKRADIVIQSPTLKLPLELKRDFHSDLWTACMKQLDRFYTHDLNAFGYGIYVVFWFGKKRGVKIPSHPNKEPQPETPEELEKQLQLLIPSEDRNRLKAVVVDLTPP